MDILCKLKFTCSDKELLKTTLKLLDLALKKIDLERPLKRIKLEPVEVPTILIPSTSHPKSHPIARAVEPVQLVRFWPDHFYNEFLLF